MKFFNKNNILPQFLIITATILNVLAAGAWATTTSCASTSSINEVQKTQEIEKPILLQSPRTSENLVYFSDLQNSKIKDTNILYTFEVLVSDDTGKNKEIMKLRPLSQ